jgi:hypothetical protein
MTSHPIVWINGKPEEQDIGTTLKDLRFAFNGAHLVGRNDKLPHRADNFVLGINQEYDLITSGNNCMNDRQLSEK